MRWMAALTVGLTCLALACGDDETTPGPTGTGGTGASSTGGSSTGGSATGGSATGGGATGGGATGGSATGGGGGGESGPDPQFLPSPTGTCPNIVQGTVSFAPAGIPARDVEIFIGPEAQTLDGPLVFWWHGMIGEPSSAPGGLGSTMAWVLDAGGIVAAPYAVATPYAWYLVAGNQEDDLLVADEVLACAMQSVGVDVRHIHSMGMSAGALHTTQMSYRRSGYLASVATYSGGLQSSAPAHQDPSNLFAAMILHGGPNDDAFLSFMELSEAYRDDLQGKGHFAFICDHDGGHTIPFDARASVGQFFEDHPFGVTPSPYAGGLPASFPGYCAL